MNRMKTYRRAMLLLMAVISVSCISGCGKKQQETGSADTDTLTIGMTQDIDSMDPAKAESAATREVLFNVYEGLVKPDIDGNLNPAVASAVEISADGTTYSFTLREGVKFHNGETVTAEDVKYSIERYRDSTTGGSLVGAFEAVDRVEIRDASHVDVILKEADTDFMAYFTIGITPAAVADLDQTPVGTGPYKYVSRTPLENVTFEKFADYWDAEGAAHIPNVIYKITSNTDSIGIELAGGSLDLFYRTPEAQLSQLPPDEFTVYEGTMNLVQALYLNNAVEPFDDVRVRQALCYCIDKVQIKDLVSGGKGEEVGSSMYPAFGKYFMPELNDAYQTDLEKAKALLEEAGYADGFTFTIHVSSAHPQHIETAQVLKEQFKNIGVTAQIQQIEWNSWLSDVYTGRNYEATVVGVDASALNAPSMLSRFQSDAGNNFVNFNSSHYDEVYAAACETVDDAEKTKLYKECLTILSDEAASVYIQDLPSFVVLNNRFTGYEFYPLYAQNIAFIRAAE